MSNHRVTTFLGALDTRKIVQIVRSSWNRVFVLKNEAHFSWKTGLIVINVWAWWSFHASCNNHYPPVYRNNRHINHLPSEQTTREWPCLSVLSHTKHTIKDLAAVKSTMESVSDEHKQTDPSVQAVDHASAGHRKKIYRVAGVAFSQHQTLTIICCASSTTIILKWIQSDSIRHGQHSGRWDWIFKKFWRR